MSGYEGASSLSTLILLASICPAFRNLQCNPRVAKIESQPCKLRFEESAKRMGAIEAMNWQPAPEERPPGLAATFRLDPIHLRILQILERDARTSVSRIAREVGLTDNAVRYRLRKLRSTGVVRRVTVHVDPARMGRTRTGVALLKLGPTADLARLSKHPCVAMVLPTQGRYQAVVLFTARDGADLERLVAEGLRMEPGVEEATLLSVDAGTDVPIPPSACAGGELPLA